VLELRNLHAFYGNSHTIQDVSLRIEEGDFVSILGRNGVGKTTLLRAILGLMDKTSGSIKLAGEEIKDKDTSARARRHWLRTAGAGHSPQIHGSGEPVPGDLREPHEQWKDRRLGV